MERRSTERRRSGIVFGFVWSIGLLLVGVPQVVAQSDRSILDILPQPRGQDPQSSICPTPEQLRGRFKPIHSIDVNSSWSEVAMPEDCSQDLFQPGGNSRESRGGDLTIFLWQPTNLFHQPLYFDDQPLERYGQTIAPLLQPLISGARFFLQIPAMPYKMTIDRPFDCVTTLGYYRPGDCAPCVKQLPPWQWNAAIVEAATIAGLILLLP